MDHITKLYYNKAVSLQEKYDRLFATYKKLMEDSSSRAFGEAGEDIYKILEVGEDATPEQIRKAHRAKILKYHPDVVKNLPEAERLAAENQFKRVQTAYEIASDPSSGNAMDYREGRKKYSASQQPKTSAEPKAKQPSPQKPEAKPSPQAAPKPQPQPEAKAQAKPKPAPETGPKPPPGRAPRPSEAGFDDFIKQKAEEMRKEAQAQQKASAEAARQKAAAGYAEKQKAAERANPKPGSAAGKPTTKQATPAQQPTAAKPSVGQKAGNLAKGLGRGVAGFGAGMVGYEIGRGISDTAMDVAGVENQVARDIAGEAAGGAGFGTAAAATGTALKGGGLIGLKAAGAAAGVGALTGLAAYGGYKAGEAISNIEVDKKTGKQVSDVLGSIAYKTPMVKMATNLIAGNKLLADTADLYEKPKGVAGGDPTKISQNIAGEEEEEAQKKAEMEERIARAASRRKGM